MKFAGPLFFLIIIVVFTANTWGFPLQRAKGGAVCLLMDEEPSVDPLAANSPTEYDLIRACYITLFELGPDNTPQRYLCRDFKIDLLNAELYLTLHDAGFSNGRKITAGDCKFTIERAAAKRADLRYALRGIKGVDEYVEQASGEVAGLVVVSPTELIIRMYSSESTADVLEALCNPALGILSRDHYRVVGRQYFNAPVTSGPFTFTRSRDGIVLTPQPNFPFGRPWLDSITIKHGAGESAHLDFSVGAADLLETPPEYYEQYKEDITFTGHMAEKGVLLEYFILLDPAMSPLNEAKVRRAIRLAIDDTGLAEVTLGGAALDTYRVPEDASSMEYRGRFEAAKASLADYAGIESPIYLGYPSDDGRSALMAEKIALNIEQLGITVIPSAIVDFGKTGMKRGCGMLLMPVPFLNTDDLSPELIISLARSWGFGGDALANKASADETAGGCCLPLLRPQRLIVTSNNFNPPILGQLGEIDFYHLSQG